MIVRYDNFIFVYLVPSCRFPFFLVFDLYGVGFAGYVEKIHLLYMGISCSFLEGMFIIGPLRIELLGMTVHFELHGIIGSRIVSVDTINYVHHLLIIVIGICTYVRYSTF